MSPSIELNDYLTQSAAAELLGINRRTIGRWINSGKLTVVRIGGMPMVCRSEIEKIKGKAEAAAEPTAASS